MSAPVEQAEREAGARDHAPELEDWIRHLAAIERPSASDGEREAAEWIAAQLRGLGADARVERELAHGGFWWPVGIPNAAAAIAALLARRRPSRRRRLAAAVLGGVGAALLWDDLGHGARRHRRLLPRRATWNVVAEAGDRSARRTVVLVAHHDAAHSGAVFNPAIPQLLARAFPQTHSRSHKSAPIMFAVWVGPLLTALGGLVGARRLLAVGGTFGAGATAAMIDIGRSPSVPAANDNLSAVGALLAVAQSLQREPIEGLRVLLVSTGSEESFSEGMQAFGRRHFAGLPREQTEFLCLECVGSPDLNVVEGEGMLKMRDYPEETRAALARAAAEAGVPIGRGLRTTAATDAIIALRAGYRAVTLAAVDATKWPSNYHWPSDVPDNLSWATIADAIRVCDRFIRSRAGAEPTA